jgi:hypothetical protein
MSKVRQNWKIKKVCDLDDDITQITYPLELIEKVSWQ